MIRKLVVCFEVRMTQLAHEDVTVHNTCLSSSDSSDSSTFGIYIAWSGASGQACS